MNWHEKPQDTGQIIKVEYMPLGEQGCLQRVTDRSDGEVTYKLFPWKVKGEFAPWNGEVSIRKRGRKLTAQAAEKLMKGN